MTYDENIGEIYRASRQDSPNSAQIDFSVEVNKKCPKIYTDTAILLEKNTKEKSMASYPMEEKELLWKQ